MMDALVSIVMPTYNQDRFIGKAIQTVIDQSYPHWELIVVNNFSTDTTKSVVESFQDQRIKVIDFANGGVIAASRNLAIKMSAGSLVAFLDSDDYWSREKLSSCLAKLASGYDLVCHGEYFFSDGSEAFVPTTYGPESNCRFLDLLSNGNCLSTSAIVVKKSLLEKIGFFDETKLLNTAEDFDLWIRAAKSGARIGILDEMLGYYRLHSTSASASQVRNAKASLAVLDKYSGDRSLSLYGWMKAAMYRTRVRFFIVRTNLRGFITGILSF